VQDLIGGQIDLACVEASNVVPHLRGGKIKAYAVLTEKRWAVAPDIPTIAEAGVPGSTMTFWHGLWAPKGTPKEIVAKLNDAVVKALEDPAVQKRVAQLGMTIPPKAELTPEALHDFHKAEIDKWWPIIKSFGIKVN
jgi:tripartite-type tricarboxylate transporter receptor subunit TctC